MFKKSGILKLKDNMNFYIHNRQKIYNYNLTEELNSNIFNTVMICIKDNLNNTLFEAEGKVEYRKPMKYIYDIYIGEKNLTEFLLDNENKYIDVELVVIKQIEDEIEEGEKIKNESRKYKDKEKS